MPEMLDIIQPFPSTRPLWHKTLALSPLCHNNRSWDTLTGVENTTASIVLKSMHAVLLSPFEIDVVTTAGRTEAAASSNPLTSAQSPPARTASRHIAKTRAGP